MLTLYGKKIFILEDFKVNIFQSWLNRVSLMFHFVNISFRFRLNPHYLFTCLLPFSIFPGKKIDWL